MAWEDLARKGNAKAQYNLGLVYTTGQAVQKDERIAAQWFHKAAEQGLIDAQYRLGLLYHTGRGVEPSMQEAAHWYRRAAEQGNRQAQFDLGVFMKTARAQSRTFTKRPSGTTGRQSKATCAPNTIWVFCTMRGKV